MATLIWQHTLLYTVYITCIRGTVYIVSWANMPCFRAQYFVVTHFISTINMNIIDVTDVTSVHVVTDVTDGTAVTDVMDLPFLHQKSFGLSCLSSCLSLTLLRIVPITLYTAKSVVSQQAIPHSHILHF